MAEPGTVRVAAVQLGAGVDLEANLATCLRMIDEAAGHGPDLIVLPEFCNHASWYDDQAHCHAVSLDLDGPFLAAVAARAAAHGCYIVINCTLRRAGGRASGTSLLYGPGGELVAASDKQVLMGHENDFLQPAREPGPVVETPIGRIGMYACMDGVINETPRGLALRGAQILCNSLNSFARDEAALHVPVRAAENRVFVVAANKVAPLLPEALLGPVSQATSIPEEFLHGAGESQIVAPDGTVLARGPLVGEAVVVADIDPSQADDKRRPDGTDSFGARRPELYAAIGHPGAAVTGVPGAAALEAAIFQPSAEGADAIPEAAAAVAAAAAAGVRLLVLPELFCFAGGLVGDAAEAVERSQRAIQALTEACSAGACFVAASLVEPAFGGYRHTGVLIGPGGLAARQPQLHACARHAAWATNLGEAIAVTQLPWGRLAMVVGDDSIYPETFRLAALGGAEVVALPMQLLERWELETGLRERAAENRVCLVAASRPTDFGAGAIMTLQGDFTLMTPWGTRPFDGVISTPLVVEAAPAPGMTRATIHPAHAQNKLVSHRTDLLNGRPWRLAGAITGGPGLGEGAALQEKSLYR
jgi:predicted amidohydrolase